MATANCLVQVNTDCRREAARIWHARERFQSFVYANHREPTREATYPKVEDSPGEFMDSVREALNCIQKGKYRKIVLSRALEIPGDFRGRAIHWSHGLRNRFPSCHTFQVSDGKEVFMGATPEILVNHSHGKLQADALAGSISRGKNPAEDAQLQASLLTSEKELHEHRLVLDSIMRRLDDAGCQPSSRSFPSVKQLPNVQHLYTPVRGILPSGHSIFLPAHHLHPTPAVGGQPREISVADIPRLEKWERGPFAGPVGWCDFWGNGTLLVGIRSAVLGQTSMKIFAGAGIVEGSDPFREWEETNTKMQAVCSVFFPQDFPS